MQYTHRNDSVAAGASSPYPGWHWFPDSFLAVSDNATGFDLPPLQPYVFSADAAAAAMVAAAHAARTAQRQFVLLAIGPLTNVARAVQLAPDFVNSVDRIVIMGGAIFAPGNVPPANVSEWNIYGDPAAAAIVLGAFGTKAFLVPLDVVYPVPCDDNFRSTVCVSDPLQARRPRATWDADLVLLCEAFDIVCGWQVPDEFAGALLVSWLVCFMFAAVVVSCNRG